MISLQEIAREYGLSDDEAANILKLSAGIRQIGLNNYTMNDVMASYFRRRFARHRKRVISSAGK